MNSNSIRDIFVSANYDGESNGSEKAPFTSISAALDVSSPGSRIIIKEGTYSESVSIQTSGTLSEPIKIEAEKENKVLITSSWFLYDSSDIIISGINFCNIGSQALSIIGLCERNSINNVSFENCGTDSKTPCTLFIGGSGSNCNVIEKCNFSVSNSQTKSIGVMISEGNSDEEAKANRNIIVRENSFNGYDTSIIIGTGDNIDEKGLYGHIIEGNRIINCKSEGIRLRVGDIFVKDNLFKNCDNYGITIKSGVEQTVSFNRFDNCHTAINVESDDILIRQNIFINSKSNVINIDIDESGPKGSIAINHNTFIQDSNNTNPCIKLSETRPLIARKNLLFNSNSIINEDATSKSTFLEKNFSNINESGNSLCPFLDYNFTDLEMGNFSSNTKFGANGWQVEGELIPESERIAVKSLSKDNNAVDALINEVDSKELYSRSFFMNQEDNEDEEPLEEEDNGDITDYSAWDWVDNYNKEVLSLEIYYLYIGYTLEYFQPLSL